MKNIIEKAIRSVEDRRDKIRLEQRHKGSNPNVAYSRVVGCLFNFCDNLWTL